MHGFSWVTDELAAMSRPGDLRRSLEFLKDQGIDVIITLTEYELNSTLIEEFGFEYHHIPIADFTPPTQYQIDEFISIVRAATRAGRKTVVHCLAGRGRTGTLAACYLVSLGRTPEEALAEIRSSRPGSVETVEQEEAVHEYAKRLQKK